MAAGEVRLRLVRADELPATNPLGEAFEFGLQGVKQRILPGQRSADGGFARDFALGVKPGPDAARRTFLGDYASGRPTIASSTSPGARYLAGSGSIASRRGWAASTGRWSGRAQAAGRRLVADMTGWSPHDGRKQVAWRLAE